VTAVDYACAPRGIDGGAAGLTLTGEFQLVIGGRQSWIPHSAERVLTYLALADRPVSRARLAGALWRDESGERAAKSLRTALWRRGGGCWRSAC
jgi:DNA-binding SARP family transcriptional activator